MEDFMAEHLSEFFIEDPRTIKSLLKLSSIVYSLSVEDLFLALNEVRKSITDKEYISTYIEFFGELSLIGVNTKVGVEILKESSEFFN